jgi:hypothetical protein
MDRTAPQSNVRKSGFRPSDRHGANTGKAELPLSSPAPYLKAEPTGVARRGNPCQRRRNCIVGPRKQAGESKGIFVVFRLD